MNIAFDITAIFEDTSNTHEVNNFVFHMLKKMIGMDKQNQYFCFNLFEESYIKKMLHTENVKDIYFFTGRHRELITDQDFKNIFGEILERFLNVNQIDVFYVTLPFSINITCYEKDWFKGVSTVAMIYDLPPYIMGKNDMTDEKKYIRYMESAEMLHWIDECFVCSNSMKENVNNYLDYPQEHIHVIGECAGGERCDWNAISVAALSVLNSLEIKKNTDIETDSVKKIAFFTPLPPMKTGISDYSVDILAQLEKEFNIDIYIDHYKAEFCEKENVHIYSVEEFEQRAHQYDRIVYQVGNSLYHQYMFPFIKKYPGIVVLHDLNLFEVLEGMYLYKSYEPEKFMNCCLEDYSRQMVDKYMKLVQTPYKYQLEVNGFVTNYAQSIIVHSQYAKKKLLEKNIGRSVNVISQYAAANIDVNKENIRRELNVDKECLIFAAFGYVHRSKRIIQILEAFGQICEEQTELNIQFYFVGGMVEELRQDFEAKILEYHLEHKVIVTGYVSLDEFNKYLEIADVCVNLRYPYNGETSGSLIRSLAKGKCVIVNRIGSFCEIPENACVMIDSVENMDRTEEIKQIYTAMKKTMVEPFRKNVQYMAKEYAKSNLNAERIGSMYISVIKKNRENRSALSEDFFIKLADKYLADYTEKEMRGLAKTVAYLLSNE